MVSFPLKIFYDGSCLVCAAEMNVYRKRNPQNRFQFIDISTAGFSPEVYGKTREEFMAAMHVLDAEGDFITGVDAFMAIWQAYPSRSVYRLLSVLVGLPGINLLSRLGYKVFARYRHLLPKNKNLCQDGSCGLDPPG
ncbi:MAG: DUF393 domain-containing protein [Desulfuromonadales bacterium]|nr:DUF393 domain-containing protein [Desulfuromonadales bacterium]MBN2791835.1 DUF393 domain-containing protein [Desulfuromonadales bacterium]